MSIGAALVAIVIVIAIAVLAMQAAENRNDRLKSRKSDEDGRLERERDEARDELEQLRERVKVLERIATDPSRRTAEEIEKLRDE
ncbi:MAG: hypothetical protein WBA68_06350 [Alteraurantiacibacter sp.]